VLSDVETVGAVHIYTATGMPVVGLTGYSAPGESDAAAVCRRLGLAKQISPLDWEVRVTFSTRPLGNRKDPRPENWPDDPTLRPIQWRWRGYNENVVRDTDRDFTAEHPYGKPLTNVLGDIYTSEDRTVFHGRGTLILSKNYRVAPIIYWDSLRNTTCSRVFWSFSPPNLAFLEMEAEELYENGVAYTRVTFTFSHEPLGWDRWIAHKGPRYKDSAGKIHYACDDFGVSSTQEVYLFMGASDADPKLGTRMTKEELLQSGPLFDVRKMYESHDWLTFQLG
jgi:hypothetical protein